MNWKQYNPSMAARIVPPMVVCVLTAIPTIWVVHQTAAQHATGNWNSAEAVIRTSSFEAADAKSARLMPGCDLGYAYTVNGTQLAGTDLTTLGTPGLWLRGGPKSATTKYRVGDLVRIRYNPHTPTESVLEAGLAGREVASAAAGVGVFGILSAIALAAAIGGATRRTGRTIPDKLIAGAFNRTMPHR